MTIHRTGTMPTDRPERYAKQLAGHWSRKAAVEEGDDTTTITMGDGQSVAMTPVEGVLNLVASVPDDGDVDRWAQVVADHLQRFGARDELVVTWS